MNSRLGESFLEHASASPRKETNILRHSCPIHRALKDTRETRRMLILSRKPAQSVAFKLHLLKYQFFLKSRFELQLWVIVPCTQRVDLMMSLPGKISPASVPLLLGKDASEAGEKAVLPGLQPVWKGGIFRTTALKDNIFKGPRNTTLPVPTPVRWEAGKCSLEVQSPRSSHCREFLKTVSLVFQVTQLLGLVYSTNKSPAAILHFRSSPARVFFWD